MPPDYLAPGVYIQETPNGAHAIEGVATSITAFVGRTASGPTDRPQPVYSFADFERIYGGLSLDSPLSYAVRDFFLNGGSHAVIVRIVHRAASGAADEHAPITDADIADPALEATPRGLWLLDQADLVNLICIPPLSTTSDVGRATWDAAIEYARSRRAFVIVDPPSAWTTAAQASAAVDQFVIRDSHAALYFPRLRVRDPLRANQLDTCAPCGAVAGIYARTDATRGVWKAPAGNEAALHGVTGLSVILAERDSGPLNRQSINCLRNFPLYGNVAWGARTLAGTGAPQSEYKYVPVRRTALFIAESLHRGLQWVAFEPNGEPLWAAVRASVATFLDRLWRQGAFQGTSPREAYFVKCGTDTTTQADKDHGLVNIEVGFAPLKPAEFVILRIQQLATQSVA